MKIKTKLTIIFLVMVSLPMFFIGMLGYVSARDSLKREILAGLRLAAEGKESEVLEYMENKRQRARDFASGAFVSEEVEKIISIKDAEQRKKAAGDLNDLLKENKRPLDSDILEINVFDLRGRAIASTGRDVLGSDEDREQPFFVNGKKTTYIQSPYIHEHRGVRHRFIPVATPIRSLKDDRVIGVLMNGYALRDIEDLLSGKRSERLGALTSEEEFEDFEFTLFNNDKTLIASSKEWGAGFLGMKIETEPVLRCIDSSEEINKEWVDYRGEAVWGASDCLQIEKDWKWVLAATRKKAGAFAPVIRLRNVFIIIGAVILAGVVFLAFVVARTITRPIYDLHKGSEIIGAGNLDHKVGTDSKDEIGQLSRAFDGMTESLKTVTVSRDELNKEIEERRLADEALRSLTLRYEAILASVPDIVMEVDINKIYTWANKAGREFFGDDVIGKDAAFYFEGEQETYVKVQPLFEGSEDVIYVESWQRRKDGAKRLLAWWCRVLKDAEGNVKGALSTARDITESKKAAERIARLTRLYAVLSKINEAIIRTGEPEELYRQACRIIVEDGLLEMAWIGIVDPDTLLVKPVASFGHVEDYLDSAISINENVPEGRGPTGTAIRKGDYYICNDIEQDPIMQPWRVKALKLGYRSSAAFALKLGTQTIGSINLYSSTARFFQEEEEEEKKLLIALADDISFAVKSMEAENKLKESEIKYRCIFTEARDGIALIDAETGLIVDCNPEFERQTGMPSERLKNMKIWEISQPDKINAAQKLFFEISKSGFGGSGEFEFQKPDGQSVPVEFLSKAITLKGRRYIKSISRDVTERKKAEEKIRESDGFIKNILETVGEGFIVIGRDYKIISVNRAYCEQVKLPHCDIIGRHCYEVSHGINVPCYEAGEECSVRHVFETGEPHACIHTHYGKDGNPIYVETKSFPMRGPDGKIDAAIEIINDITERRRLEEQYRHAQKMEAVGRLTGGVAHDFNNILTAIMGYGSLLLSDMAEDDPLRVYVEEMLASAERAASLTQGLLAFSRKQVIHPMLTDFNEIVRRVTKLLSRLIGEDIDLEVAPSDGELPVLVDGPQMEQMIMNLATNARDAMPRGGILTISTDAVEMDDEYIKTHGYGKKGRYALVSVSDTGVGMDRQTLERIFEPFFTTKELGRGTGLGLAIVYGIVKQHGGYINAYSESGEGTSFKIYLPLTDAEPKEAKEEVSALPYGAGTETILLAEDDMNVRGLIKAVLERAGYGVIEAVDGEDAIRVFGENMDRISLLLLDVIMPKKDGKEVYEEVKKARPGSRVIFISGYTSDIIHKKGILEEGIDFITKPVAPRGLLSKIREVLDR